MKIWYMGGGLWIVFYFLKLLIFGQIPSFYPDLLNICHPPKIVWTLWLFNFLILIWSFLQIFFTEYQVVERKNESIFFFYVYTIYTWFNYDMCENISYSQCLLYVSWLSSYVWTVISYIVDYIFTSYKLRTYRLWYKIEIDIVKFIKIFYSYPASHFE